MTGPEDKVKILSVFSDNITIHSISVPQHLSIMKKILIPLREQFNKKFIKESDTPFVIYTAVFAGLILSLFIKQYHEDLSLNLFSEIIGAAFTLFVIDVLLVRSKTKRWLVVQKHVDYLIARTVNRLRDGLSTRVFSFQPVFTTGASEEAGMLEIREQRNSLLKELSQLNSHDLSGRISLELFSEDNYEYFNEKADEVWNVLNMKYSEYLAPPLVLLLIALHSNLKDVCGHIRFYKKAERFPQEKTYYQSSGIKGAALNLKEIIRIVNELKEEGYSEAARKIE